jgi:acetoin utilization deacetylase AcuC-like enzyme
MTVSVFWHPSSIKHSAGPGHPESPTRIEAILTELKSSAVPTDISWQQSEPAEDAWLSAVHEGEYLAQLRDLSGNGGGRLDEDTATNEHSYQAAVYGAGAAVGAARSAISGSPAFAAIRPPGHHATADTAMGFCLINNVVVAAMWALGHAGVQRILIIDWRVSATCRSTSGHSIREPVGRKIGVLAMCSTYRDHRGCPAPIMWPTSRLQ